MLTSQARVETQSGDKYLIALIKHWAHHLPAAHLNGVGVVAFPMGTARFHAGPDELTMTLFCNSEVALTGLEKGVAEHLARFAFREKPEIAWVRPPS